MTHLDRPCSRVGEITTGPVGFSSTDSIAHQPCDSHRPTTIPGVSRSHCPLAPADVAACSTCVATIVQRVRGLGCWVAEGFPWSGRLLKCAERQADVWVWTGSSVTWMLELSPHWMDGALRSSLMGCPSGTGHSWPLVSPCMATALHDGTQPPRAVALQAARRAKETTFPELSGEGGKARLVVLAAEVGGRWSQETADFLNAMAKTRAQESPQILQGRVRTAVVRRWSAILACSLARSLLLSLLERRPVPGTGGDIPSVHEVVRDARFG